jgi:hypothetical protein
MPGEEAGKVHRFAAKFGVDSLDVEAVMEISFPRP